MEKQPFHPALVEAERARAVQLLQTERCSCVICCGDNIRMFYGRGVCDLYHLLQDEPSVLHHAFVADRIIGKAAAALLVLGRVETVYTPVISTPALELFRANGVSVVYDAEVPYIVNRQLTGWCPLEARCLSAVTPEACLVCIKQFFEELKTKEKTEK